MTLDMVRGWASAHGITLEVSDERKSWTFTRSESKRIVWYPETATLLVAEPDGTYDTKHCLDAHQIMEFLRREWKLSNRYV
jgi:hypothetical protein